MKIAVIGATGLIGIPVTRQLINAGFEVTLVVRDTDKARRLFPDGNIIKADLRDKALLINALKDCDALYLSLNTVQNAAKKDWLPEREGLLNALKQQRRQV